MKGNFQGVKSIWKAHMDYYKNLNILKEKRKLVKKLVKPNSTIPFLNKSIVFEFYIKRKNLQQPDNRKELIKCEDTR